MKVRVRKKNNATNAMFLRRAPRLHNKVSFAVWQRAKVEYAQE